MATKTFEISDFKQSNPNAPYRSTAYANAFSNVDSSKEITCVGAFDEYLPAYLTNPLVMLNHSWDEPVGKCLKVIPDQKGLLVETSLSATTRGKDTMTLLKDGVISRMSIGYRVVEAADFTLKEVKSYWDVYNYTPTKTDLARARDGARMLKTIELFEVSYVSVPCNDEARVVATEKNRAAIDQEMHEVRVIMLKNELSIIQRRNEAAALKLKYPQQDIYNQLYAQCVVRSAQASLDRAQESLCRR